MVEEQRRKEQVWRALSLAASHSLQSEPRPCSRVTRAQVRVQQTQGKDPYPGSLASHAPSPATFPGEQGRSSSRNRDRERERERERAEREQQGLL